jgi:hypothetical protein
MTKRASPGVAVGVGAPGEGVDVDRPIDAVAAAAGTRRSAKRAMREGTEPSRLARDG